MAGALGILGGTFDPVHVGHLALAHEAHGALGLELVLFVPNAQPPHKRGQEVSAAEHREAMLKLAIADEPALALSRLELERPGPSYAVDTVATIAAQSQADGRPEPWFVLSAEVLDDFHTWREPLRILALCRVAVSPRPGSGRLDRAWLSQHYPGLEDRFTFLAGPLVAVAATQIRERVASGEAITGLVPPAVEAYIRDHGLYRSAGEAGIMESATTQGGHRRVSEEQPGAGEHPGAEVLPGAEVPAGADLLPAADLLPPAEALLAEDAQPALTAEEAPVALDPRRARRPGLPVRRTAVDPEAVERDVDPGVIDAATLAMAHRVVDLAAAKKASDIVLLDVRSQTAMTDYFVICSGASDRQLGAIADGIGEGLRDDGISSISREGDASSHWVLLDFGGVIVHVMSVPEREFYQLEKLWSKAALLVHVV